MLIRGTNLSMIRGDSESLTIEIEESDGTPYEFQEGDIAAVDFTEYIRQEDISKITNAEIDTFLNV